MILTVIAVFVRLLIQWSLNREHKRADQRRDNASQQQLNPDIIEKVEAKSCLDAFFLYASPQRLGWFFLVSYMLVYIICASVLLR